MEIFFEGASYTKQTNVLEGKDAGRETIHTSVVFFPCRQIEVGQRRDLGGDGPPGTSQIKCL